MACSLNLEEVERYRHDGCLLVQSVLADEDLRLLDEAVREVTKGPRQDGLPSACAQQHQELEYQE